MSDAYTPTTEQVRRFWATDGTHVPAAKSSDEPTSAAEFDRWLAAHDREVRERVAREILDEADNYAGDAAREFAEIFAQVVRGAGDAHNPERCPTCGCELAYPTAAHVVDCGEGGRVSDMLTRPGLVIATAAIQRWSDQRPCAVCGGDLLRPAFDGRIDCHMPWPKEDQTDE